MKLFDYAPLSLLWREFLQSEFKKPYFLEIEKRYLEALESPNTIFPKSSNLFNALNLTPPHAVKIILLGQDPYHSTYLENNNELPVAMGLSFSVNINAPIPPSLRNIYKELHANLGVPIACCGDLSAWAKRGMLLLNAILSVEKHKAASHKHIGWERFSDRILERLFETTTPLIVVLLGQVAQKKSALIPSNKHIVITAPHPSPLARGFLGSGVFSNIQKAYREIYHTDFDFSL
ncbi:uracil-DNA glycosylase [Helicobacter cetorum]|uniref:Uracil-DNA glycosylase n=1 Tax=Helicobacter cetorum (strain ATCC BAA-540 / CCUG 52418 / MIT 99-5656) TaxID=1163745 RepID=I0ESE7_HELCM|nr:uracil-DNA glycosylase [Helicobacter cetorum]AFI05866.1 uracil-DNA glycosylase [Helicobacter cetorum MIT 99-5656]